VAEYAFERLSAQDLSFLMAETSATPMHVAGLQLLELGPLATPEGGVDFAAIRRGYEAVLHRIPRYRQRLRWTPLVGNAVWVDDPHFRLDFHLRHAALPRPGTLEQLKRLAGRLVAQPLDRERPLWELWVIEGLEGGRFAILSKLHHCMIDGLAGADLATILMSTAPDAPLAEPPPYVPRPTPSGVELLWRELRRRAFLPLRFARGLAGLGRSAAAAAGELAARLRAIRELLGFAVRPASGTPLNGEIGPHRRCDWLAHSLADVKALRRAAACTVNDVVLATAAGALRGYLLSRGVDPAALDFRVSAPVSVRGEAERGRLGNRVSSWIVRLPLEEADPALRLAAVRNATEALKRSKQALGVETMMQLAEWTPPVLLGLGARAANGPINALVTNVPGPQFPLFLLGARLLELIPLAPLLPNLGLAIGLFSYDGRIFWGLNADYELLPDLSHFAAGLDAAFGDLAAAFDVKLQAAAG
jgi:WS/DGAT/MGAT family acyltransferase